MPFVDPEAALLLQELIESRGYSPEQLAEAITERSKQNGWERGTVDAHTIRRVLSHSHVPGVRVRLVIATFFDRPPHEIWKPSRRVQVPSERERTFA